MGQLTIEQKAEPVGMAEIGSFAGGVEFGKGLSHSRKPELAQLVECRMGQQDHLLSGSSEVRGYWGGAAARRLPVAVAGLGDRVVVEDRAHRTVGQGADLDRPHSGG